MNLYVAVGGDEYVLACHLVTGCNYYVNCSLTAYFILHVHFSREYPALYCWHHHIITALILPVHDAETQTVAHDEDVVLGFRFY